MAKTINHPPYEIDPWKANTTNPPSELPFSPEIVEEVEKPKQEPVPPQSTEGQQKIEESISKVERFNNEINALREQQEQVLQEVQVGIDETSNKIKQLNELEERIKQQVADYTEDTDRFLREAGQLKGELEEAQGKMDKAITDASSAITAAESAQNALEAYKNGEKARLEEAIKEAQVGVAKADEVNKQIADLQNSLGGEIDKQISANNTIKEIQSNNEALGARLDDVLETSKKGVEDAAKAIELLNSNIDIGGSLIALVPGTSTPIWAEKLEKTEEVTPDGEEVYVANDNISYQSATKKLVKASDKIEYLVSFWHKSSVPGSKMFVQLSSYDEKGDPVNAVKYRKDKTETDDGSVHWYKRSQTYVISGLQGETEWTKYEYVIGLEPGTEFVFLNGLWWNHNSAPVKAAQYLGGFRVDPLIPSQADVDKAQNKAIEANSLALEQQKAINKANEEFKSLQTDFNASQAKLNKTYNAMWDAQGERNLLQEGINKSQNEAIKANTLALENQLAINDKQSGIAAAHAKAIDSNRKAIRSLAKIDLGGSLLAYMPLTDAEIEKGITREYLPAWAANATNVLNDSNTSRGYYFLGSKGGSAKGGEVYAQVSQGTQYLLDIELASSNYFVSRIVFKTSNSGIKNPIKKFYWTKRDEYGWLKTTTDKDDTNTVAFSSTGGRTSVLIEFKEDVEDICVDRLEWGSVDSMTVKRFTLAPYTPSQAAIDAQQNEALEGLKLAQDLQRDMVKQQQDFTTKLYDMSAGVIHLWRDEAAGSIAHEIGFTMPSTNRLFEIYARTSFHGNLTILVNYNKGVGDGLKTYRVKDSNLATMNNTEFIGSSIIKESLFADKPSSCRYGVVKVDIGDVESIVVLIDHDNWKQG